MADVLISDLSFSQPLSGDELLPIVQNGTSYKVSVSSVGNAGDTENINGCDNTIVSGSTVSSIVGGCSNTLDGNCSAILGGTISTLSADFGVIGGGANHTINSIGGVIGGGSQNTIDENTFIDTIGGGNGNCVGASFKNSFIGGGLGNMMTSHSPDRFCSSFSSYTNSIISGRENNLGGFCFTKTMCSNTIAGGQGNGIGGIALQTYPNEDFTANHNFIGGGRGNSINGNCSGIAAGHRNRVFANLSGAFIGGGVYNTIRNVDGTSNGHHSSILGGKCNYITGSCSSIAGGNQNTLSADFGFVGGGTDHIVNGIGGTIGGGSQNKIDENTFIDTIGGGNGNCVGASFKNSFIGGGLGNMMTSHSPDRFCSSFSSYTNSIISGRENNLGGFCFTKTMCSNTIAGGQGNGIGGIALQTYPNEDFTANHNFIGGGRGNSINGNCSGIAAGHRNRVFANLSGAFIGGGVYNTIRNVDGTSNGHHSSILGGKCNTISHDESFIAGTGITSVSSNMLHANTLYLSAAALPTTDPGIPGVVWRDGTDLKISV